MSSPSDPWYGRAPAGEPTVEAGLARRTRGLIVLGEATLAAVVGGIVVGGAIGWTVAVLGVVVAAMVLAGARGSWLSAAPVPVAPDAAADLVSRLRILGVPSRSSGDVGVISDGQGFAAGVEIDIAKGALFDLATLVGVAAADPSRPAALQMRLTTYAPPAAGFGTYRQAASVAVHRRLHVLLRLEPAWADDVVARHGGGAQGSRAALVAAVDRLSARLRRAGIANRVLDTAALNALLAEDTAPDLPSQLFTADLGSTADLERLIGLLQQTAPERSIVSLCVDLASSDQWQSFAAVLVGARRGEQVAAVAAVLLADPAVGGVAAPSALSTVLPLGGGPGDLASVLTLARV